MICKHLTEIILRALSCFEEMESVFLLVVRDDVERLIEALRNHELGHRNDGYYLKVRAREPSNTLDIAARFIYLNRTCYNGLYRVNKAGKFKVVKGRYKNPDICNAERLRAASGVLQKATIRLGDFERVDKPSPSDFIYCDPPYDECFTGYQPGGLTPDDQARLRKAVARWTDDGADVIVCNSDTLLTRRLYRGGRFYVQKTEAPRPINSRVNGRCAVSEIIVTSYG